MDGVYREEDRVAAEIALKQPLGSNPDLFMGHPETAKLLETVDHRLGYGLPERSPLTLVGLHVDPQGGYERVPPEALKRFRTRLLTLLTRALHTREGERLPDEIFWLPPYYYVVLPETDQFQCLIPIQRLLAVLRPELAGLMGPGHPFRIAIGSATVRSGNPGVSNTLTVARTVESLMMAMAGQGVPLSPDEGTEALVPSDVRFYHYPWDDPVVGGPVQKPVRRPASHPASRSFKREPELPKPWWRHGK